MNARVGRLEGAAAGFALLTLACASGVRAETVKLHADSAPAAALVAAAQNPPEIVGPWSAPTPHKTLQLDSKGRWGVRLDMEQPSGRDPDLKDYTAGAYYSLTPRIRVGGSVGLGDKFSNPTRLTPEDAAAPRVKLETRFRF